MTARPAKNSRSDCVVLPDCDGAPRLASSCATALRSLSPKGKQSATRPETKPTLAPELWHWQQKRGKPDDGNCVDRPVPCTLDRRIYRYQRSIVGPLKLVWIERRSKARRTAPDRFSHRRTIRLWRAHSGQIPQLAEGDEILGSLVGTPSKNDMVEEMNLEQLTGPHEVPRDPYISLTRRRIATGMVVY